MKRITQAALSLTVAMAGVSSASAATITGFTTSSGPDTPTVYNTSGAMLTSIEIDNAIVYTDLNPFASTDNLSFAGSSTYAYASSGTDPGSSAVALNPDITQGGANLTGDFFFDSDYQTGNLIYLFEFGGTDDINLTLLDSSGTAVSSPLATSIADNTGFDLNFTTNGTNSPTQDIAGLALFESDFANVTGDVAGIRIENRGSNTNGTDILTVGYAVIPEPASLGLVGLGALCLAGRRRRLS